MSSARFRSLALGLPGAEEKSHFGKADFRVRDRIFAGFTADGTAYVKLSLEQQDMLTSAEPKTVSPIPGGWGRRGWTLINQKSADATLMKSVLQMAWANVAPQRLIRDLTPSAPKKR